MNVFFWVGFAVGISAGGLALALLILFICITCDRDDSKYRDSDQGDLP
jgi:hypothetical protein